MKRLLAAFLPSESREHVLGDLQQRGFRLRDILSVLPRVWLAHFRREYVGPVPSFAAAPTAAIRRRSDQLDRRGFYGLTAFSAVNFASAHYSYTHGAGSQDLVPFSLWLFPIIWLANVSFRGFVRIRGAHRPNPDHDWQVAIYRTSLSAAAANSALMPLMIAGTFFLLPLSRLPRWGLVAAIAASLLVISAAFAVGRHRCLRLLEERAKSLNEPSAKEVAP